METQVASKRREQIESLKKIIDLSLDQTEAPSLLFRLGELYWEESKFHEFEANRKDDDLIKAMNRNDARQDRRAPRREGGAAGQGQAVRQARARAVHEDRPGT